MTTRRFAVIGDPVTHSASPRMHAAAYVALGLDCTYEAIHATAHDLPDVIARLRAGELDGLNVTIPHKRSVLAYVDLVAPSAEGVGAANTLVRSKDGQVVAHNTDVPAIATELRGLAPHVPREGWTRAHVLVLGTGATALSAVVALGCDLGVARITVRGRALGDDVAKASFGAAVTKRLAHTTSTVTVAFEPWAPVVTTERDILAIVQATSLGMNGGDAGDIAANVVAWKDVSADAVALDVVYASTVTPFVHAAKARGLTAADGRGMLARQGALAFELWFARPAPLDAMRAALAA